ncbi:unnamed protein product [Moneuplotes crassus]|uniref:Uncharacterized protein n=1 Tax=Euplotes crassus TaxID=5936 RepID=A0AAD1X7G5_EUPCR|nr:unnamed protein product [Moneuplotes crassus]
MTSNWDFNRMFQKKVKRILNECKQGSPPKKRVIGYSFSLASRNSAFNQTIGGTRAFANLGPGYYDSSQDMRTTFMSNSPSYSFNKEDPYLCKRMSKKGSHNDKLIKRLKERLQRNRSHSVERIRSSQFQRFSRSKRFTSTMKDELLRLQKTRDFSKKNFIKINIKNQPDQGKVKVLRQICKKNRQEREKLAKENAKTRFNHEILKKKKMIAVRNALFSKN